MRAETNWPGHNLRSACLAKVAFSAMVPVEVSIVLLGVSNVP